MWVYDRVTTRYYDYVMIAIIGFNCFGMALEGPYVRHSVAASPASATCQSTSLTMAWQQPILLAP